MNDASDRSAQPRSSGRLLAAVAAVVAFAALGLAVYSVVRTREPQQLVLRDSAGRERIRLSANKDGPTIELLDEQGQARAALRQQGDRVMLELWQKGGDNYAMRLTAGPIVGSIVDLRDADSGAIVDVAADPRGGGMSVTTPAGGISLDTDPSMNSQLTMSFQDQTSWLELWPGRTTLSLDSKRALDSRELTP